MEDALIQNSEKYARKLQDLFVKTKFAVDKYDKICNNLIMIRHQIHVKL